MLTQTTYTEQHVTAFDAAERAARDALRTFLCPHPARQHGYQPMALLPAQVVDGCCYYCRQPVRAR